MTPAEQINIIFERRKSEKKDLLDDMKKDSRNPFMYGYESAFLAHIKINAVIEYLDAPQEQKGE